MLEHPLDQPGALIVMLRVGELDADEEELDGTRGSTACSTRTATCIDPPSPASRSNSTTESPRGTLPRSRRREKP
jgi:hypothetical protein